MAYNDEREYVDRSYIYGNTVRVISPERLPQPDKKEETKPAQKPQIRPGRRRRAKRLSPAFAIFSAAAGILVAAAAISCVVMQTDITTRLKRISGLEQELLDMQEQNTQLETEIALLTDGTYIYETAVVKLGMVPADESNIIYYDKTESEYVRQYEYVP